MNEWGEANSRPVTVESPAGDLLIWDWEKPGTRYVIGADVAEGKVRDIGAGKRMPGSSFLSDRPDYSAAIVIELETARHVASWHGYCPPSEWAGALVALSKIYNDAFLVPEINGPGLAAVDVMVRVLRYPNLYRRKTWGADIQGEWSTGEWGWCTSRVTRPLLIQRVHEWLKSEVGTRDPGLIKELRTMEIDEQGTARARGKNKDDRVIALGLALEGRYELLHGTTSSSIAEGSSRLDSFEAAVWDRVKEQQKHGRSRNGPPVISRPGAGFNVRSGGPYGR